MKKPTILIPCSNVNATALESITSDTELLYSDRASALAVMAAGGLPLYMPALAQLSQADIEHYVSLADGVLLTGADTNMNPIYYGETPLKLAKASRIDDERDRIDIAVAQSARAHNLPILGVCKGMQTMNVAFGGTLYQDVSLQHEGSFNHNVSKTNRANFTHAVDLAEHSLLRDIFGESTTHINGGHQQAVKDLGKDLRAAATAKDSVVEAFEETAGSFVLGLQFHAELRVFDPKFLSIFQRFVAAARRSE